MSLSASGFRRLVPILRRPRISLAVMLFGLFLAGIGIRRHVFTAQCRALNRNELPFTLEGALNFRRVRQVFEEGVLPRLDPDVQYPDGVIVRENDTVGAEYVYAALARLFPGRVPLASRVRWMEVSWFCLGIPLAGLWVWWWKRSRWGAFVASAFYATAISSVIRSTGQEISHENFALPLLLGHLALQAAARSVARGAVWVRGGSLALLGLALATWDLVQYYLLLWMLWSAWLWWRGAPGDETPPRRAWVSQFALLLVLGLANPYLRAHGFLLSPAMLAGWGILLGWGVQRGVESGRLRPFWARPWVVPAAMLTPLVLGLTLVAPFGGPYGHFVSLLAAKVRFLNVKPADPSLLDFDQRILWAPALHSATLALTHTLFPAMLPAALVIAPVVRRGRNRLADPEFRKLLFCFLVSLAAFVLFVRFHVFLAVFAAVLLGVCAARSRERGRWVSIPVTAALLLGLAAEAANTIGRPERWGRTWVYYAELDELCGWLRRQAMLEPVLANFGVSASIVTYANCPVLLQPKFESREARGRVREYGELLFKGGEKELRDWADARGARYYVYAMGEFSEVAPQQQMRYFVDALHPSTNSPAWVFENRPEESRYFRLLWGNRKYRVFRIRTRADEARARSYAVEAREALESARLDRAEERATAALMLNPEEGEAQSVLQHAGSLREQRFGYGGDEPR